MSVGLQHRWMDSRSIDQCDRVVCMNVNIIYIHLHYLLNNGHWSREWLVSVIVFFLKMIGWLSIRCILSYALAIDPRKGLIVHD